MNTIIIAVTIGILLIYSICIQLFLKGNETIKQQLNKAAYIFYLILLLAGIILIQIAIADRDWIDKVIYLLILLFANPLFLIFPFSNLTKKMGTKAKSILSIVLLLASGTLLSFGLIGMTSAGNTWGNSGLFYGLLFTVWTLPNFLLATFMTSNYRFAGIVRQVLGIGSLFIGITTMAGSDYNGNLEHNARLISFLACIYLAYEGYQFILKYKSDNQILTKDQA